MKNLFRLLSAATVMAILGNSTAAGAPTCSEFGFVNHGQHAVVNYVLGLPLGTPFAWPPAGEIGAAVRQSGGAAVPGGPGAGGHLDAGLPPGASFCNPQAKSGGR